MRSGHDVNPLSDPFKSPDFRMVERCVGRRRPSGGGSGSLRGGFGVSRRAADAVVVPGVAHRGATVGATRRSARRRVHDSVEGLLRPGGVVPVGGRQVLEAALVAHDGDGRVGQAGEIARQIAHMRPAAVLVVGEVAHVVQPVLESSIGLLLFQSKFSAFQISVQHTETRQ